MKIKNCRNCGHANPMENVYCSKCGTVFKNMIPQLGSIEIKSNDQKKKKHIPLWVIAVGAAILVCVLILSGSVHKHTWSDATCTDPKICRECAKTEGVALGHQWREATCTESEICGVCGEVKGVPLGHSWNDATCTNPATCRRCDETEPALGHDWNAATCVAPEICRRCSERQGAALGHDWVEATCTDPKRCKNCTQIEGRALGHSWTNATYQQAKTCTRCKITDGRSLAYPLTYCKSLENSNEPNSNTDVQVGSFTDAFDVFRPNSLKFWVADKPNWADTEYIVYKLDSNYELLEFTISAAKKSDRNGTTKILIYADNVLVYESGWIGNSTYPVQDSLDVSGVNELRIVCTTDSPVFCHSIFDSVLFAQAN